ncbi:cyclin-like protein [Cunninghamella echinulata]|nr:cyclin-like protein [Cunninghamella echinulata]
MAASSLSPKATTPTTPLAFGSYYKRRFRPYFTKKQLATIDQLNEQSLRSSQSINTHASSCKFMQEVGKSLGFPQTTISTSQSLYHRFYLYYSPRTYSLLEVCITCLFVGSKIEETIKKLRDIYIVAHSVRNPKQQELDPENISDDRLSKIIEYEKLLLEILCYNFQIKHPYEYIVKFSRKIQEIQNINGKLLARKAYSLAIDSYRITLCLEYPAHTIAAGCLYLASKLWQHEDESFKGLNQHSWDKVFLSRLEDIEDIGRKILDLYISRPSEFGPSNKYMQIKIQYNEEASGRQDNRLDYQTKIDDKWEPNQLPSDVDLFNTNAHTVTYYFNQ